MYHARMKHLTGLKFASYIRKEFSADTLEGLDEAILDEWPNANESNTQTMRVWED